MTSRNSNYWKKRAEEIANIQFNKADQVTKKIVREYQNAERHIQEEINLYYARYADEYEVSMAEAKKLLSPSELGNFKMTIEEFREKAINNKDDKWTRELDEIYLQGRISRLNALKNDIKNHVNNLCNKQKNIAEKHLTNVFNDTYNRNMKLYGKELGIGENFARLNNNVVHQAIYQRWLNEKNFAGRINDNKKDLLSNLNRIIEQGLTAGKSSDSMIEELMKKTKISRNRARNLIQTETAFIIGQANTKMYKDFGVEEYEIIETLDGSTCETCAAMDGKVIKLSDKKEGITAPPFHTNCRGTTIPVSKHANIWGESERAARDGEGKTYYTNAKTYGEWEKFKKEVNFKRKYTSKFGEQIYTDQEIKNMLLDVRKITDKYVNLASKWSGNIVIDNSKESAKLWNCDIRTPNITSKHELLHEQLHSRSISYFDRKTYRKYMRIEEASVQLLCEEISKIEKIEIISSEFEEMVGNLRKLNSEIHIESNDLLFAQRLFNIPVTDRLDFLEKSLYDSVKSNVIDIKKANELSKLMEVLYDT